jgi:phytoene dehydrogenase-like protein
MNYDVVVVGSGIGGLTVAALLAARGVNVCVLERNSQVGGCVGRIEYSGFDFEPGMGLYTGWGAGEIYDQIFSELPVNIPEARLIESDYVVRLPDGVDVQLRKDPDAWSDELRNAFPECVEQATQFYHLIDDAATSSKSPVVEQLAGTSSRFQRFIDAQLRAFIQTPIERCVFQAACQALRLPREKIYSIQGGPAALAETLARSIKAAGGRVRLDSPVLRLAYDEGGNAIGVDLLSGERVLANRAIVSNMTIWDTYGKLIGLNRTPPEVKKMIATLTSTGVYLVYASAADFVVKRLPSERFLVCSNEADESLDTSDISFAASSVQSLAGKRAVTLKANCPVSGWFAFQSSAEDFEAWDQEALERVWTRLHQAVPELNGDIEVIETANPRTLYDDTRRKLGMVLGIESIWQTVGLFDCRTTLRNVFMIGDTVSGVAELAKLSRAGLQLANTLLA